MRRHVPHQLQNKIDVFAKSCEFSESYESPSIAVALSREAGEKRQVFAPPGHRDKLGLDCFGHFFSFRLFRLFRVVSVVSFRFSRFGGFVSPFRVLVCACP